MEQQDFDTPLHRFFVEDIRSDLVALPAGEAHHAARVLRLGVGAEVELFDGRGQVAQGRIAEAKKGVVTVAIERRKGPAVRRWPLAHLAFAVPKGNRLDWLLEKATELGAASLCPIICQRSVGGGTKLGLAKRNRWQLHCIAAAKQCGLNFLPEIHDLTDIQEFLAAGLASSARIRLFGDTGAEASPLPAVIGPATGNPQVEVAIVVGPEGGLTDAERKLLVEAGFHPVRMGRTTLRVETAAVALLAAVMAICDVDNSPQLPPASIRSWQERLEHGTL